MQTFGVHFFFYAWTFMALYFCVSAPVIAKALLSKTPVYLDSAPYLGWLMPHAQVGQGTFQWAFFAVTAALYVPLLFVSKLVLHPLDWLVRLVYSMNELQRRTVQAFLFALAALLIAGIMIHLYHAIALPRALGIPFVLVVLALVFMVSQQGGGKK